MYCRQISKVPKKLIKNGRPLFGTYLGFPSHLDIRGVKTPFGVIPLPTFLTNIAIRSQLFLDFNAGDYIGQIGLFDAKIFGYIEVIYWNKNTNVKCAYRTFTGPRKRLIPNNLKKGIAISFKKTRYLKISWDRDKNRFSILFNLQGDDSRPTTKAHFSGITGQTNDMISVMPAPTSRRCSATWLCNFPIRGSLSTTKNKETKYMEPTDGNAIISINRSYYKLHAKFNNLTATGNSNGHKIVFYLTTSSFDANDTNSCNSNALFVDNEITPLPQVFITHSFGVDKTWIIQDTENMVDLTFTPVSDNLRKMNTVVFRTVYHTIFGTFEGTLLDKNGESIPIKGLQGIVQTTMLRL